MELREYQTKLKQNILNGWSKGAKNIIAVLPTGAGKTVIFSEIIKDLNAPTCAIAHRCELVGQISLALARNGIYHDIIAPATVRKEIISVHIKELGKHYVKINALCRVAGVDTIIRRNKELASWLATIELWVIDEAHHVLKKNKWGKAVCMFPNENVRGLGVTATPIRADGFGLGRHNHGVFDELIEGETAGNLIKDGYLTKYKIYAPVTKLELDKVKISADGDYNHKQLVEVTQESTIVGDIVEHYQRIAAGKLGITFATDVETAGFIAANYRKAGIPAEMICAETSPLIRSETLRRFRNRELLQLVNVDLFGEGFDLPAIEVVSMARPTHSFALYSQQFGRGLRPLEGKEHALIIDHVGNVMRHGLPDTPHEWSLEAASSKAAKSVVNIKICPDCYAVYEKYKKVCPQCGYYPEPRSRTSVEEVDGDLCELTEETLEMLRGKIREIDKTDAQVAAELSIKHCPFVGILAAVKRNKERNDAQGRLRELIAFYGGAIKAQGLTDAGGYRLFYHHFGVDVLTAQTLGKKEADDLSKQLRAKLECLVKSTTLN
jgi:DNA repair protein RadD